MVGMFCTHVRGFGGFFGPFWLNDLGGLVWKIYRDFSFSFSFFYEWILHGDYVSLYINLGIIHVILKKKIKKKIELYELEKDVDDI